MIVGDGLETHHALLFLIFLSKKIQTLSGVFGWKLGAADNMDFFVCEMSDRTLGGFFALAVLIFLGVVFSATVFKRKEPGEVWWHYLIPLAMFILILALIPSVLHLRELICGQ